MNAYEHLRLDYLRLVEFANMILDPEKYGHAVTPEVRDAAREALGLTKVEVRQTAGTHAGRFKDLESNWNPMTEWKPIPHPPKENN